MTGSWIDAIEPGWLTDVLRAAGVTQAVVRHIETQPLGVGMDAGATAGGAVITEAGTHDQVAALVYVAAFAPDKGESVNTLIADPPPGAPVPPILPAEEAAFLADAQVPGRRHVATLGPAEQGGVWP